MIATANVMQRIRDGRTDLVFDWVSSGHPATANDEQGVSLIEWCAYYGDVIAIPPSHGQAGICAPTPF